MNSKILARTELNTNAAGVRLAEKAHGIISLLEIVTPGRRSVLEPVQRLLFGLRVQIVQVESAIHDHGIVECFHVVEFDGAPIRRGRAAVIVSAVEHALRTPEAAA
jgi:hypothetical protein